MTTTGPDGASGPAPRPSRRQLQREALIRDVKDAARRLLVGGGVDALTLGAVARDVGVTPAALYRYFDGRDALVTEVARDLVGELVAHLGERVAAFETNDVGVRLVAASHGLRAWSVAHPREFILLFGIPSRSALQRHIADDWVRRLADVFGPLFEELWRTRPFPVVAEEALDPQLRQTLRVYRATVGVDLPLGAVRVFLDCWRALYGALCLEVFGHMGDAVPDHEAWFSALVGDLVARLGAPADSADPWPAARRETGGS